MRHLPRCPFGRHWRWRSIHRSTSHGPISRSRAARESPQSRFASAIRTISASISAGVRGLPGPRFAAPSYFRGINLLCHTSNVPGVRIVATSARSFLPNPLALAAERRCGSSLNKWIEPSPDRSRQTQYREQLAGSNESTKRLIILFGSRHHILGSPYGARYCLVSSALASLSAPNVSVAGSNFTSRPSR